MKSFKSQQDINKIQKVLSSWGSWLCTVKNGKKCSSKIRALLKKTENKKCEISVTKKDIEKIPTILIFWGQKLSQNIFTKIRELPLFMGVNGFKLVWTFIIKFNSMLHHGIVEILHMCTSTQHSKIFFTCPVNISPQTLTILLHIWTSPETLRKCFTLEHLC